MAIETICQGCGKKLRVGEQYAGRQARCPECGDVYRVPELNAGTSQGSDDKLTTTERGATTTNDSSHPDSATTGPLSQAASSTEQWYMKTPEGQIYGPASRQQLHQWVAEGRVTDDCYLRRGEHGPWNGAGEVFPQLSPRSQSAQPSGGTYVSGYPRSTYSQPHRAGGYGGGRHVQPHRGGLILTFAILGWAMCPIFSVVAWTMGTTDMQLMRRGMMDNSGLGITQAGQILGMIHTILSGFALGFFFLMMLCSVAAQAG